jgi:hypothetical protein
MRDEQNGKLANLYFKINGKLSEPQVYKMAILIKAN